MKSVGILGVGEVGSSIKKLTQKHFKVFCKDLNYDQLKQPVDVLHICIPFKQSNSFVKTSIQTIKQAKPKLTIINSTVKPGTTRQIYQHTKLPIAHTPIMGVHPHLAKYQTHFTKVIGPIDHKSYRLARSHWKNLGAPKILRFNSPEESELAKLLSTTYYGWNIVFNKLVYKLCKQKNLGFNQVYTKFNQVYNQGYQVTKPGVTRPILKHISGPIGGHCVIPNLEILAESFNQPEFNWMLEFNQSLKDQES